MANLIEPPGSYQLLGASDEGGPGDLLERLSPREARQRLQALIAEWLAMENLVVLTGSGCSCSAGGKTMATLESTVLSTVLELSDIPDSIKSVLNLRLADVALDTAACSFEDWLSFIVNARVLACEGSSPFSGVTWKGEAAPSPNDLTWLVKWVGNAIFAECSLALPVETGGEAGNEPETYFPSLEAWLGRFGLGRQVGPRVSVVDLSMLSHEVLPYACSLIGRILLETRENLPAAGRYKHPWVLVLEEAHNYARPPRSDEERGQKLSRSAFERIAKEGRKFGLSLIIASQRTSEISPTILSQCANFVSHRLQNPDDIEHFRRIIPMQARRLLDQVTILASGEAIVFGSAFHIPTRVQFDRADPGPHSQTAAPYLEWKTESKPFPISEVVEAWGVRRPPTPLPE